MKFGDAEFRDALIPQIASMRAFARALARDHDAADDIVQEALLAAWQARATLRNLESIRPWLLQVVRNAHLRNCRLQARVVSEPLDLDRDYPAGGANEDQRIAFDDARAALMRLADLEREAVMLVAVQGLTYAQAAHVIGCPSGTVKSRVHRARGLLREMLTGGRSDRPSATMSDQPARLSGPARDTHCAKVSASPLDCGVADASRYNSPIGCQVGDAAALVQAPGGERPERIRPLADQARYPAFMK